MVVAVTAFAYPLAMAAQAGALGLPRNDDWTYIQSTIRSAETHRLVLPDFIQAMTVGQTVMALGVMALAGRSIVVFDVLGSMLGAVAIVSSFVLIRRVIPQRLALVVTASIVLGPVYGSLAPTFMTDLPAMAFAYLALLALARACRRLPSGGGLAAGPLVLAAGLTFVGFTIREYAVAVIPVMVLAVAWLGRGRPRRRDIWLLATVTIALSLAVSAAFVWRQGESQAIGHDIQLLSAFDLTKVGYLTLTGMAFLMAVALGGFLVGFTTGRRPRSGVSDGSWRAIRPWRLLLLLGCLPPLGWAAAQLASPRPFVPMIGNYVAQAQSYWQATANAPYPFLPKLAWVCLWAVSAIMTLAGLFWGAFLVSSRLAGLSAGKSGRRTDDREQGRGPRAGGAPPERQVATVIAAAYGFLALLLPLAATLVRPASMFDRYLLPAVPCLSAVVIATALEWRIPARRITAGAVAGLVILGSYGFWQTDLTATFDAARWDLGTSAVARGLAADTVDAGYEWWGYHQRGLPSLAASGPVNGAGFEVTLYPDPVVCLVIAEGHALVPGHEGEAPWVQVERSTLFGTPVIVKGFRVPGDCR